MNSVAYISSGSMAVAPSGARCATPSMRPPFGRVHAGIAALAFVQTKFDAIWTGEAPGAPGNPKPSA